MHATHTNNHSCERTTTDNDRPLPRVEVWSGLPLPDVFAKQIQIILTVPSSRNDLLRIVLPTHYSDEHI